jgi:uncharacterized protein
MADLMPIYRLPLWACKPLRQGRLAVLDAGAALRQTSLVFFKSDAFMGKYLLLIGGALLVYWIVRASLLRRRRDVAQRQDKAASEDMVRCVECGVHLPRGESLTVRGQYYCCVEHQRRHDPGV